MKRIIIFILVILSIISVIIVIDYSKFKVTGITPKDVLPTSTDAISVKFNRNLRSIDKQPTDIVVISPNIPFDSVISSKTLTIKLRKQLDNNIKVLIKVNVMSEDGSNISKSYDLITKYVEFNKLPKNEQELQIADSAITGDNHPLLSLLPVDNLSYKISFILDDKADKKNIESSDFIITIETFTPVSNYSIEDYRSINNEIRKQALEWIKEESGIDPNNIVINYIPSDDTISGVEEIGD